MCYYLNVHFQGQRIKQVQSLLFSGMLRCLCWYLIADNVRQPIPPISGVKPPKKYSEQPDA